MKQYLTPEQTAKLIELGFVPKTKIKEVRVVLYEVTIVNNCNFTIDELIEMLGYDLYSMHYLGMSWEVKGEQLAVTKEELIDALYDMVVKLKEDVVI